MKRVVKLGYFDSPQLQDHLFDNKFQCCGLLTKLKSYRSFNRRSVDYYHIIPKLWDDPRFKKGSEVYLDR